VEGGHRPQGRGTRCAVGPHVVLLPRRGEGVRRLRLVPAPAQRIPRSRREGSADVRLAPGTHGERLRGHGLIGSPMAAPDTVATRKGNEFLLSECYVTVMGASCIIVLQTILMTIAAYTL